MGAHDGTVSIVQPLIAPLYQGKTAHEFIVAFTKRPDAASDDLVRDFWKANHGRFTSGVAAMTAPSVARPLLA